MRRLLPCLCLCLLAACSDSGKSESDTVETPRQNNSAYNPNKTVNEAGLVEPDMQAVDIAIQNGAAGIRHRPDASVLEQLSNMSVAAVALGGKCKVNKAGHKPSEWGVRPDSSVIHLTPDEFKGMGKTMEQRRAQFIDLVNMSALKHGMDPILIDAIVITESSYNPNARSPRNAMGLMQLLPGTAKEQGVRDPFNPAQNVNGGTSYLKDMIVKMQGDVALGIAAYNSGPGYEQWCGYHVPPMQETHNYVRRVSGYYNYAVKRGGL